MTSQHIQASIEDACAGGAWRVWVGRLSGWGFFNLCQLHRKAVLAFLGGFGNLPRQDCHPAGRALFWGPRRGSRDPEIRSELPGVGFVRIWARSCVVLTGLLEGWYPANIAEERLERASRGPTAGLGGRALHGTLQLVSIDVIRWCENSGGKLV